jgi:hypothetical protein
MATDDWWNTDHPDALDHRRHLARVGIEDAAKRAPKLPPPTQRRKPNSNLGYVTEKSLSQTLEMIGRAVGEEFKKRDDRIDAVERAALTDGGVWRASRHYKVGAIVTDKGALWVSKSDNESRPGEGPNWRLLHKTMKATGDSGSRGRTVVSAK